MDFIFVETRALNKTMEKINFEECLNIWKLMYSVLTNLLKNLTYLHQREREREREKKPGHLRHHFILKNEVNKWVRKKIKKSQNILNVKLLEWLMILAPYFENTWNVPSYYGFNRWIGFLFWMPYTLKKDFCQDVINNV